MISKFDSFVKNKIVICFRKQILLKNHMYFLLNHFGQNDN